MCMVVNLVVLPGCAFLKVGHRCKLRTCGLNAMAVTPNGIWRKPLVSRVRRTCQPVEDATHTLIAMTLIAMKTRGLFCWGQLIVGFRSLCQHWRFR